MKLFDSTFQVLERALDVRSARHQKLANNIANLDTPGHRPRDLDFQASLDALLALPAMHEGQGSSTSGTPARDAKDAAWVEVAGAESAPTPDGNTVDLDGNMTALSVNGELYAATTRMTQKRLAMLRYAASDGAA